MSETVFTSLRSFAEHMERLRIRERVADTEARGEVAHSLVAEIQRRLGHPEFFPPRLKPATMKKHRLYGIMGGAQGGNTPLLLTGKMRQSIGWNHVGTTETVGLTLVGSSVPYAKWQEMGGSVKGRPPKRSFLASTARAKDKQLFRIYVSAYKRVLNL